MKTAKHAVRGRCASGSTLLELLIVVSVLLMALMAISQSLGASMGLTSTNRESALAMDGLQRRVELMAGEDEFSDVFALYNDDPTDDPIGQIAPGGAFQVPGLRPTDDDPDGFVGETIFPVVDNSGDLELREDVVDPQLGMPRDLNADGDVDEDDHTGDYALLPVTLRIRFQARNGPRELELHTLLADR